MKMVRAVCWIPLLLVGCAHAFSTQGLATQVRRASALEIPLTNSHESPGKVIVASPLFASSIREIGTPRQSKRQWIRNLFGRRLPTKARRLFTALFVALSIWLSNGIAGPAPAHAASPIAVRFTGMEVVARGPEWSSSLGSLDGSSDMLSMAMQKRQAALSRGGQQTVTTAARTTTTTMMAAAIVAGIGLPATAGVAWFRRADAAHGDEDLVADEVMLTKQKELIDQVSTLSQAAAADDASTDGAGNSLGSELVFLALTGLSAYATYAMYKPPE